MKGWGLVCAIVGFILLLVSMFTRWGPKYDVLVKVHLLIPSMLMCSIGIIVGVASCPCWKCSACCSFSCKTRCSLAAGILLIISVFFALLAVSIFTAHGGLEGDYTQGYILVWVALVIILLAGILYICAYCCTRGRTAILKGLTDCFCCIRKGLTDCFCCIRKGLTDCFCCSCL